LVKNQLFHYIERRSRNDEIGTGHLKHVINGMGKRAAEKGGDGKKGLSGRRRRTSGPRVSKSL